MKAERTVPDIQGMKVVEIKGTLDPVKLRRLRNRAIEQERKEKEEEARKKARMTDKEKEEAQAAEEERERAQRISACIAEIPVALECAAREGRSCAYVFSSPRNDENIAPEILAYCKTLEKTYKGLRVKYETESVQPQGFADEFTPNDTIYHVVVVW